MFPDDEEDLPLALKLVTAERDRLRVRLGTARYMLQQVYEWIWDDKADIEVDKIGDVLRMLSQDDENEPTLGR
jgi:hypothetical protein